MIPLEDWKIYAKPGWQNLREFAPGQGEIDPDDLITSVTEGGRLKREQMPQAYQQRAALYTRYLDREVFEVSRMVSGLFLNIDPSENNCLELTDMDLGADADNHQDERPVVSGISRVT